MCSQQSNSTLNQKQIEQVMDECSSRMTRFQFFQAAGKAAGILSSIVMEDWKNYRTPLGRKGRKELYMGKIPSYVCEAARTEAQKKTAPQEPAPRGFHKTPIIFRPANKRLPSPTPSKTSPSRSMREPNRSAFL